MFTTTLLLMAIALTPLDDGTADASSKSKADETPVRLSDGWVSIFNGRTLEGWTPKIAGHALGEDPYNTVRVEDGMIRVSYDGYEGPFNGRFMHLFYIAPQHEYDLLVEYRFTGDQAAGGPGWAWRNSGAMLHCQDPRTMSVDQSFPVSIEGQFLGGDGTHPRTTMNLCTPGTHVVMNDSLQKRHCINSSSQTHHGDKWVTAIFKVRNGHVQHYVDESLVLEYKDPQLDPGDADAQKLIKNDAVALNNGWISLQGESHPIDFKRVWIRPIKASTPAAPVKAAPAQP